MTNVHFGAALLREPIAVQRVLCEFDTGGVGSKGRCVSFW